MKLQLKRYFGEWSGKELYQEELKFKNSLVSKNNFHTQSKYIDFHTDYVIKARVQ